VARFKAAGVTIADARNPNYDIPPKLGASLPRAQQVAVGAAVQACPSFGRVIADGFGQGMASEIKQGYRLDPQSRACISTWFDAPARRGLVAKMTLNTNPNAQDDSQLAGLVVDCIGMAPFAEEASHLSFTPAETTCINTLARNDSALRAGLTQVIETNGNGAGVAIDAFILRTFSCLTPAHILQIGKQVAHSTSSARQPG
jgi:hypothetical protein